ncbi:MAG: hypothetical protein H6742_14285 [Alphaproteobacteria bacterium]|nr:hypothetical protein [Alphaproteobacteria bacterium]
MPVLDDRQLRERLQRIHPQLLQHAAPIACQIGDGKAEGQFGIATGIVLAVGSRLIAVTAAHVFERPDLVQFGLLPKWRTERGSIVWLEARQAHLAGGGDYDTLDLALFEVTPEETNAWGVTPVLIDQVRVYDLQPGDLGVVHGFPFAQADVDYRGIDITTRHFTLASYSLPESQWDRRYKRGVHHVLQFTQQDACRVEGDQLVPDTLPNPKGISGCGIWTMTEREDGTLDLWLVGVEFAWMERERQILAQTMRPVLEAIQRAYPDLASLVDEAAVVVAASV